MHKPSTADLARDIEAFILRERADRMPPGFDARSDLIETGILDSLFLMQLVAYLEDAFHVTLDPESVTPENFVSVQQIVSVVEARS